MMAEIALPRQLPIMGPTSRAGENYCTSQPLSSSMQSRYRIPSGTLIVPHPPTSESEKSDSFLLEQPDEAAVRDSEPAKKIGHTRARNSVHALPSFTFNSLDATGLVTGSTTPPDESEADAPVTPTRASRHRRIASEHISANSAGGAVRLRSRSPLKHDAKIQPTESGPPRGHRHRRSGAISSQDLSTVVRPNASTAPPSSNTAQPAIPGHIQRPSISFLEHNDTVLAHSTISTAAENSGDILNDSSQSRSTAQARVGFSDTLEFIPRPLSTISSETESSISTVRGHSVADSISSLLSGGTISPVTKLSPVARPTTSENNSPIPRPKSAGMVVDRSRRGLMNITHDLAHLRRPTSASAPSSPCSSQLTETSGGYGFQTLIQPNPITQRDVHKSRNVKSWATSLVHRKSKSPEYQGRVESPSKSLSSPSRIHPQLCENFDEDPTSTIFYDVPVLTSTLTGRSNELGESINSARVEPSPTVIDLDLADQPFEGSNSANHGLTGKNRTFSTARYSMHSSGSLGGFSGPGMHYHRRTESAPELDSMELDRPALRRLHSSSSTEAVHEMEDVFEEDEEEADVPKVTQTEPATVTESLPAEHPSPSRRPRSFQRPVSSRLNRPSRIINTRATGPDEHQGTLPLPNPEGHTGGVMVFDDLPAPFETYRTGSFDSTPASPEPQKDVGADNTPFSVLQSRSNPATPTDLTFLSPYVGYSLPHSFSTPVLDTFPDSRKYSGYALAENSSEFRPSTDDVPSLISSRSGLNSAAHTHIPSVSSRNYADCAASFKSSNSALPQTESRRKRASIASLSRLVGGSFGEKSKLSNEHVAPRPSTSPSKSTKDKRSHRLGRLLHFWKPKEPFRR